MSPHHPLAPISRRRFLAGGGALAGAVVLGACGDDDGSGTGSSTTQSPSSGLALAQFFGGAPMLAAGAEVRAPFGVADADGILSVDDTPESLLVSLIGPDGTEVMEPTEVAAHAKGLPRAYFPLRFTVDDAGIYTARTEVRGEALEMAIQVDTPDAVEVIKPGERLPSIDTPTTADGRGVDPICTNDPVCPLHDITVTDALAEGRPMGLLVATPAFCQFAICGPVLDVLLAAAGDHPDVRLVHAEVYVDPKADLDAKTPAVEDLHLTFEPCLVLVDADGVVVDRIDTIYDEDEVGEALARLT